MGLVDYLDIASTAFNHSNLADFQLDLRNFVKPSLDIP